MFNNLFEYVEGLAKDYGSREKQVSLSLIGHHAKICILYVLVKGNKRCNMKLYIGWVTFVLFRSTLYISALPPSIGVNLQQ